MHRAPEHDTYEEVIVSDPPLPKRARSGSACELASKRQRQVVLANRNGPLLGTGSASSMAQQQSTPEVIIPDTQLDDDSDVEIIGETQVQAQDDDVQVIELSPEQLAGQQSKGKSRLQQVPPKKEPQEEEAEFERQVREMMFNTSEELHQMINAAGSSRRQAFLMKCVAEVKRRHRLQQSQQRAAAPAAAAAAADDHHLQDSDYDAVILETQLPEGEDEIGIHNTCGEQQPQQNQQQQPQQQQVDDDEPPPAPLQQQQRRLAVHRRLQQQQQQPLQQQQREQQQQQQQQREQRQQQQQRQQREPQQQQQQQYQQREQPQQPQRQRQRRQQQQQQSAPPTASERAAAAAGTAQHVLARKLRRQFTILENSVLAQQDRLADPRETGLANYLEEWQHLDRDAKRPREASKATEVLATMAELGCKMVCSSLARAHGRRPIDLISALQRHFAASTLSGEGVDLAAVAAAAAAAGCWRGAPGVQTMVGPLAAVAKLRAVGQRRPKDPVAAQVKPVENPAANSAETQETDHWMQTMREVLSAPSNRVVPFVQLVLNHESFSQTVENIFALSFLVKDLWCSLERDEQRGLIVHSLTVAEREAKLKESKAAAEAGSSSSRAAAAAGGGGAARLQAHQFMFNMGKALWEDMKRVVPEGRGLMPHREPVLHVAAAAASRHRGATAAARH